MKTHSNRWCWFVAALLFVFASIAIRAAEVSAPAVAGKLDSLKDTIAAELTVRLGTNSLRGSYTTVWRQFEDLAIAAFAEILPRHVPELDAKNFDTGQPGREKNRLADLAIVCGTNTIEVSIKAARSSGQPENDMGTFREHEQRKRRFAASFTIWVRYEDAGRSLRAQRVFFDRTWRFVGQSTLVDGVKYRKKDGNLRPKSWAMFDADQAYWQSEAEFEAAVQRSATYRANELVKEHLTDLSEEDQRVLHERLKEKFAAPPGP